jgi:hypothetical protein
MKRLMTAAALALLTTAAQADRIHLTDSGVWRTDYYRQNGKGMCVMEAALKWQNGAVGVIDFKWSGDVGLFMHVTKTNWSIATETDIPFSITLDTATRHANGIVIADQRGGSTMETQIDEDIAIGFMDDVANAKTMTIAFDSGTEKPWVSMMNGSRKAVAAMSMCVKTVRESQPTQPGPQVSAPTAPTGKQAVKKDDGGI